MTAVVQKIHTAICAIFLIIILEFIKKRENETFIFSLVKVSCMDLKSLYLMYQKKKYTRIVGTLSFPCTD